MSRIIFIALIVLSCLLISTVLLQTGHVWLIAVIVILSTFSVIMVLRAIPPSPALHDSKSKASRYLGWFYLLGAVAVLFFIDWRHPFQQKTVLALAASAFLVWARFRLTRRPSSDSGEE